MNVFNPMFWVGVYTQAVMQFFTAGTQGDISREQLGHLGGNPRFTPPRYDTVVAMRQGIAPKRRPF